MKRQLIADCEVSVDELLPTLSTDRLDAACKRVRLPETMRSYGHVKLANA